ncbi:MAG: right-handed parallel beta-helix repeat-containing protein [Actinomycetales bacterium]|nr:right-handed parallel beta-helix repeat-containing protein [Actinomycetales bacterium]
MATATGAGAADAEACPGMVNDAPNHYVLAGDATCDLSWLGDGAYVDLAGHTLYTTNAKGTGTTTIAADDVTLARGKLRTDGIDWVQSRGRLDRVDVSAIDPTATRILIEAGRWFTVTRSHFHDLPNAIGVDFYYAGDGTVSHSRFTRTKIGVSIQGGATFTIEHSRFDRNEIGLQLWNEDWIGVNDVLVANNTFTGNTVTGVRVRAYTGALYPPAEQRTFDNVRVVGNRMLRNAGSGMDVTMYCLTEERCATGQTAVAVTRNHFTRNGLAAPQDTGDDGFTAKTLVGFGPASWVTGTQGLWVFTLTGNTTSRNADRGIDAAGVTDGGGNRSMRDANPEPCLGVACT